MYSDVWRGDKSLAKYFASWYDAVLLLEIIDRIGRSSTVLSFLTCVTWLCRKIELVLSLLGIIFCRSDNLDFIFLKTFCIFRSVAAVGSVVSRLKCLMYLIF